MKTIEVSRRLLGRFGVRHRKLFGDGVKSRGFGTFDKAAGYASGMAVALKVPINDQTGRLTADEWSQLVDMMASGGRG